MTKDQVRSTEEALKLALEFFETMQRYKGVRSNIFIKFEPTATGDYVDLREFDEKAKPTITAIKQALADSALDRMAENARELGLDYEPVWDNLPSNKDVEEAMRMKRLNQLATPPAAQRQWVGLSDDEIIQCTPNWIGTLEDVARAVETKLKEKNNG